MNKNILKIRNINLFFIILLLFADKILADENISIYQQNAINYDSSYFHKNDDFKILGNIEINGKIIILANNIYIWGLSQRATWRFLLFLSDGTFLGMYYGIYFFPIEIKINGNKIYFPFEPENGNVIDFSEGIPDTIWIDGAIHSYEKVNEL